MPGTSLLLDRLLVLAGVLLTCTLFTRSAADPVNVLKLTALLVVAVAVVASAAARGVRLRVLQLPLSIPGAAAAVLAVAFFVATAAAPVTTTAVVGTNGRNSGLLAYLAALVLFLATLRLFQGAEARLVVAGVTAAGLFTATYGLLQRVGVDAIPWNNPFNPIIASLGNPNFTSGYLGIAAATAAGGAAYRGWAAGWRLACAGTAALCLLTALLTRSVQGPIAAVAGLAVVALAVTLNLTSRRRTTGLTGLGVAAGAGALLLVLGATGRTGPAARLFTDIGSEARRHYWGAALSMLRDEPLTGVGLDQYGHFWWSARSVDAVRTLGPGQFSDAAHSVPLQMLAQGGLVLGLTYLAFVLLTLAALLRGLIRLRGEQRILLGAVGGGWAAYQVQSAVSIDQVPLLVLHFVLAGAVFAASGSSGIREVRLPGAPPAPAPSPAGRKGRARVAPPRPRALTAGDLGALAVIATIGLAAVWFSLLPLRANIAAKDGDDARALGNGSAALAAYERAVDLAPGQSLYRIKKAELFQQASPPRPEDALAALLEAREVNPYEPNTFRAAAPLAEEQGRLDLARTLHERAVALDPLNEDALTGAATFELRHSGAATARALLEDKVQVLEGSAELWATLGDARAVTGDLEGAREAYERALELDPAQPTAVTGLQKLDVQRG